MNTRIPIYFLVLFITGSCQGIFAQEYTVITIDSVDNSFHFERLQEGVKRFKDNTGHQAYLLAPAQEGDPIMQIQFIEEALRQGADAICIIPFSSKALHPVLQQAAEQGILVITHNATTEVQWKHYNLEPFEDVTYGTHLMKQLARYMDEEGEYAIMIENRALADQKVWIETALAFQEEHYPHMHFVARRLEDYGDPAIAYQKTKELLKAYPKLKGILAAAPSAITGTVRAVEEYQLEEHVMIIGVGIADEFKSYVKKGKLKLLSFWDPADLAYAMNALAVALLNGESVTEGLDLEISGYEHLTHRDNQLYGNAWIDLIQADIMP